MRHGLKYPLVAVNGDLSSLITFGLRANYKHVITYGFGLPAVAFVITSRFLRPCPRKLYISLIQTLSIGVEGLLPINSKHDCLASTYPVVSED
ncbi:hypothetical protein ACTXT7_001475 [Hymenolepis weldensis]